MRPSYPLPPDQMYTIIVRVLLLLLLRQRTPTRRSDGHIVCCRLTGQLDAALCGAHKVHVRLPGPTAGSPRRAAPGIPALHRYCCVHVIFLRSFRDLARRPYPTAIQRQRYRNNIISVRCVSSCENTHKSSRRGCTCSTILSVD